MMRFAAEALKRDRDQAIKAALKAKVPIFEVAADFGLTETEIGEILKAQGPPRRDPHDLNDARDGSGKEVIASGRRRR